MALIERFTPGGNFYPDGSSTFAVLRDIFRRQAENRDERDNAILGEVASATADRAPAEDAMQPNDNTEIVFAITDEDGKRTWLEVAADGGPTDYSLQSIAAGLGDVDLTAPGGAAELVYPTEDWAHWGDSFTAANWGPEHMAPLTGCDHYNGGWGGQVTDQIAARQGGVPARVTLPSDTLPGSGSVTLSGITRSPLSTNGNRRGSISGVSGVLARESGDVHTFTRDAEGDDITVPAGTKFIPEDGATHRDRTVTIWTGRNGFKTETPESIVQSVQQMIDYLAPTVKRVIVMEVMPWEGEELPGGSTRAKLDTLNAELRAAFRPYWLDIATWLRTEEAATYAGITFTTDDQTDIDNGITPRSLRSDAGHLNDAGYEAVAKRVHKEAQNRGWL